MPLNDAKVPCSYPEGTPKIEWEDNDADQIFGARAALANCRKADLPPSGMKHDEMLKG